MGTFSITYAAASGMLNATGLATALGASPHVRIYNGTPPANAAAALSGNTMLAELVCAATPISGYSDNGTAAVATFGAIATEASANATGTAAFFRIVNSSGATTFFQGGCGTSAADMILNTLAITAGSAVSITSATISWPYGP
jgi:hypothetical protein